MSLKTEILGMIPTGTLRVLARNQWRSPVLRRACQFGADLLRNQDGIIKHGVGKGLRFNVGRSHSGFMFGTHEPSVQKAFATLLTPGMTMFDAGANVGYYATICARLVGAAGKVVCFEPLPANAKQIEYNAKLNGFSQMTVRGVALGSSDGTARFSQSAESTWGNLASVGKLPDKYVGEIEVPLRRLDSIVLEDNLPGPDLIKIDVEGAEADVLTGARSTIAATRPLLMMELHGTNEPIAKALSVLNYEAVVLGSNHSITESPWDAYVLAAPRERADRVKSIRELCSPEITGVR